MEILGILRFRYRGKKPCPYRLFHFFSKGVDQFEINLVENKPILK